MPRPGRGSLPGPGFPLPLAGPGRQARGAAPASRPPSPPTLVGVLVRLVLLVFLPHGGPIDRAAGANTGPAEQRRRAHPARAAAQGAAALQRLLAARRCSCKSWRRRRSGRQPSGGWRHPSGGAVPCDGERDVGRCLSRVSLLAQPYSTAVPLLRSRLSLQRPPFLTAPGVPPFTVPWAPLSSQRLSSRPLSTSRRAQTRAGNPARRHRPLLWPCPRGAVPHVAGISQRCRQAAGFSPAAPANRPWCAARRAGSGTGLPAAPQSGGAALCSPVARSRRMYLCWPLQVTKNFALDINEGLLGALLKLAVVTVSTALPRLLFLPGPAL